MLTDDATCLFLTLSARSPAVLQRMAHTIPSPLFKRYYIHDFGDDVQSGKDERSESAGQAG